MILKTLTLALVLASSASSGDCLPEQAFNLGLEGAQKPATCSQRAYRIDFELGRNIRALREEQTRLRAALPAEDEETVRQQIGRRLQTVERELNQLEGLARIRGLLPSKP